MSATKLSYEVVNGTDAGRIGRAVDILLMEEIMGDWRDWLLEKMRIRPRRRWQATWIELEFAEGDHGAYRLSELRRHDG